MKQVKGFKQPYGEWISLFGVDNEPLQALCEKNDMTSSLHLLDVIYYVVFGKEKWKE